jgi:hypothetical protein
MKVTLLKYNANQWETSVSNHEFNPQKINLVLCFGGKKALANQTACKQLINQFVNAQVTFCSTAGEIYQETVLDDSLIAVALNFKHTQIATSKINIKNYTNSFDAAVSLVNQLNRQNLKYIMVLSDGSLVNGSELSKGLNYAAGDILVTGGLAGDGPNFDSTLVGLNEIPSHGNVVAIGFYGEKLIVKHGSQGGWDMFGLQKTVTKSISNVLYQINNMSALDLYKTYLGPDVANLPASALLFPLAITIADSKEPIVRTILSINEEAKSMTFAGDIPEGAQVRFMKANFDKLIDASANAAELCINHEINPDFALLISCVGRKLILRQRIEEEVEVVAQTFNNITPMVGFYSYGEISPTQLEGKCQLHNQTMTITSFYELP